VRLTGVADKFISDVRATAAKCLADPEACDKGSAAIYGMAQAIPDRSIVDQITWYLFINILILIHPSILFFHLFFLFYQTFFYFLFVFYPPFSFSFIFSLSFSMSVCTPPSPLLFFLSLPLPLPLSYRLCLSISAGLTFLHVSLYFLLSLSLYFIP
jgi:hypothetical protein